MAELTGYKGTARSLLEQTGVSIGDLIRVQTSETTLEGVLMPRYELADDRHIVIKLKNGYNIGVDIQKIRALTRLAAGEKPAYTPALEPEMNVNLQHSPDRCRGHLQHL